MDEVLKLQVIGVEQQLSVYCDNCFHVETKMTPATFSHSVSFYIIEHFNNLSVVNIK